MSKKHFIVFAECISCIENKKERERTAKLVSNVCSHFNFNFDHDKFYDACGIKTQ